MGQAGLDCGWICGEQFQLIHRDGLCEREWASLCAAQCGEMGSAAGELTELLRDRADVAAGGDSDLKARLHLCGRRACEREQGEAVNDDACRLYLDRLAGAGEFVGWHPVDFFCGEDGRSLQHLAGETRGKRAEFIEREREGLRRGCGCAVSIEGVGGKAEADGALVGFIGRREELRKARVLAKQQREHAGSHGIKRAEMADGAFAGGAAHNVDDVVRGDAGMVCRGREDRSLPHSDYARLCGAALGVGFKDSRRGGE